MIQPAQLTQTFESNFRLAKHLLEGISHPESLFTPEYRINALNWVLGHIISSRSEALKYLGKPGLWSNEELSLYKTGSDPVSPSTALRLEKLFADFEESQAGLERALAQGSEAYLSEIVETRFGDLPRWQHISGLGWHETFHVGQLDLLRQMILETRASEAVK